MEEKKTTLDKWRAVLTVIALPNTTRLDKLAWCRDIERIKQKGFSISSIHIIYISLSPLSQSSSSSTNPINIPLRTPLWPVSPLSEVIQHSLCSCWKNKPEATVWIQVNQSSPAKKGPALPQMQTSLISHRYSFEMPSRTRVGWVKVLRCTKCQRQKKTNIKLKGEV